MNFTELEDLKIQKYGTKFKGDHPLRIHRAISWGKAAEKAEGLDEKFIFYWISLNAVYSDDNLKSEPERTVRKEFFKKISEIDKENTVKNALYDIQNQLRVFVDNNYIHEDYWKSENGEITKEQFEQRKLNIFNKIYSGLVDDEYEVEVLDYLFALMAILRNQIFHGLATYNSSVNREQVHSGEIILERLLPLLVEIVTKHDEIDWGKTCYPYWRRDI